jgi:hypothetical protein
MSRKILYSPGYGAGWSTWNRKHEKFLLFDEGLIALAERKAGEGEVKEYIESKLPKQYIYTGGWRDIAVATVDGPFRIDEYDGYESIKYADSADWIDPDA